MKLKEKIIFHKAITTSREFFKEGTGIKCVHYGDIYKNYSGKKVCSSNIINSFANPVAAEKILYCDSIIVPDVTETVSDWGHFTYIEYDGTPYINGTHAIALTCSSKDELKYIFRYLSSNLNRKRLQAYLNGSTVFQINVKDFGLFSLENYHDNPVDQQHIVDILGSIDDKIENNEKKAAEIFNYGLAYLEKIYDSGNYEKRQLLSCLSLLKDGTHNPPKRVEKGIPLITGQTINNGFIDYSKMTYIQESDYKKIHSKYCPLKDDLLITKIGTLGKVAILRDMDIPITVHCNSALLRFNNIPAALAFFILNSRMFQNEFHQKKNRTVQEFINLEQLGNLEILIPIINAKEETTFNIILNQMSHINIENSKLNELKQLYLKKFFG